MDRSNEAWMGLTIVPRYSYSRAGVGIVRPEPKLRLG